MRSGGSARSCRWGCGSLWTWFSLLRRSRWRRAGDRHGRRRGGNGTERCLEVADLLILGERRRLQPLAEGAATPFEGSHRLFEGGALRSGSGEFADGCDTQEHIVQSIDIVVGGQHMRHRIGRRVSRCEQRWERGFEVSVYGCDVRFGLLANGSGGLPFLQPSFSSPLVPWKGIIVVAS